MADEVVAAVKAKYGAVAESGLSSEHAGVKAVAEAFGPDGVQFPEELVEQLEVACDLTGSDGVADEHGGHIGLLLAGRCWPWSHRASRDCGR